MPEFEIVVSAENNRYLEWQAMLFHYSCMSVLGRAPIVVVHTSEEDLLPGFELIREHGGRVQPAPNLRFVNGIEYPPRNTAAALFNVESKADYLVLCDTDMVFLTPPPFNSLPVSESTISFDFVPYMRQEFFDHEELLNQICDDDGLNPGFLTNPLICGGVPHIIPNSIRKSLSLEWQRAIDLFPVIDHPVHEGLPDYFYPKAPYINWLATMWAIVFAAHRMKLSHFETNWCVNNKNGQLTLNRAGKDSPCMIHYCFGDEVFEKRRISLDRPVTEPEFWSLPATGNNLTISETLGQQFRDTAIFFGIT